MNNTSIRDKSAIVAMPVPTGNTNNIMNNPMNANTDKLVIFFIESFLLIIEIIPKVAVASVAINNNMTRIQLVYVKALYATINIHK